MTEANIGTEILAAIIIWIGAGIISYLKKKVDGSASGHRQQPPVAPRQQSAPPAQSLQAPPPVPTGRPKPKRKASIPQKPAFDSSLEGVRAVKTPPETFRKVYVPDQNEKKRAANRRALRKGVLWSQILEPKF